jgi:hypothetical protein
MSFPSRHSCLSRLLRSSGLAIAFCLSAFGTAPAGEVGFIDRFITAGAFHNSKHCVPIGVERVFDLEQIDSPSGFVIGDIRIADYQPLAALGLNGEQFLNHVLAGFNNPSVNSERKLGINCDSFAIRKSENGKLNFRGESPKPNGVGCGIETSSPRPDFTVQMASRKPGDKKGGSVDNFSAPSPELRAVPIGPATVQFLAGNPSGGVLSCPIGSEGHLAFVHAQNIAQRLVHCNNYLEAA